MKWMLSILNTLRASDDYDFIFKVMKVSLHNSSRKALSQVYDAVQGVVEHVRSTIRNPVQEEHTYIKSDANIIRYGAEDTTLNV